MKTETHEALVEQAMRHASNILVEALANHARNSPDYVRDNLRTAVNALSVAMGPEPRSEVQGG